MNVITRNTLIKLPHLNLRHATCAVGHRGSNLVNALEPLPGHFDGRIFESLVIEPFLYLLFFQHKYSI